MSELFKERVLVVLALLLCAAIALLGAWDTPELSPVGVVYADSTEGTPLSEDTETPDDSGETEASAVITQAVLPSETPTKAEATASPPIAGKVNINTATKQQIADRLMGIGDALAQRIVDYRETFGNFASIEEIMNINGIGEGRFAAIRDDITVD